MTAETSANTPITTEKKIAYLHDDLKEEYYKIVDIVTAFDQRLLTIKGWGVTFSLATAALGFQQRHYGLFLVAAASSLAFWLVEASVKLQQMRYYPRMGDIEVAAYQFFSDLELPTPTSAPLIDWSWYTSWPRIRGGRPKGNPRQPKMWDDVNINPGKRPLFFAHVALPHAIVMSLGLTFFAIG